MKKRTPLRETVSDGGEVGTAGDRMVQEGYSELRTEWEGGAKQRRIWRKEIQGKGAACPRGMHLDCLKRT